MRLANGIVALDFDLQTGSLVQITDLRTGMEYLTASQDARLFRLFVPDDEHWIDRYGDSQESDRPEMELTGETLTIRFTDVKMADGSRSGIEAAVRVHLPAGSDEALFTLELSNHGPYPIQEVIFPWIGGWRGYPGEQSTILCGTHWPLDLFNGLRRNDGWNLLNSTRKTQTGFPHVNIPVCDASNGRAGLSFNFYPKTIDLNYDLFAMDLNEQIGDVRPSFGWVHRPFLAPGKGWQSGSVGIAPHPGGWHFAADKMRSWLSTWWKAPALPPSLRGAIGFQNAYFRDFTGREYRPLSSLPALARYGLEHGIQHLIVWDMPLLGMYLHAGLTGLFEDHPGRIAELRLALAEAREMGVTVSPLINMRLGNQVDAFWMEHGEKWSIRSRYGIPAQETLPLRRNTSALINRYLDQGGVKFCQSFSEFQEWALDNTRKVLELGFNAIFIDQPFSEDYCFSDQHGHPVPAAGHQGACAWIPRAAEIVHQYNPDGYVIGEVPDIWNTQFFELWWFWDWSWLRPEVFRYILPQSLQSWVIDAYDHEDQVNKAFAMGFLLNLNVRGMEKTIMDVPLFTQRITQLAALRRKTQAFTVDGRFMDTIGITVDTDAAITAARYDAGQKTGIVFGDCSRTRDGGGALKLTLDREALGFKPVTNAILHRQDGSTDVMNLKNFEDQIVIETRLERWEAGVIEIDKGG